MIFTIRNPRLKPTVKIRDYQNHAHLLLPQALSTKSRAKAPTVVSRTSVLSNLSRENKVSTTMIQIP
jgi:hypothetical protein|tara:strand:+ start:82 stop:282 length:201 start_codon:yes stop_codon:yes gene_type:complete